MDDTCVFYQIKFISAMKTQNFPIPLKSFNLLPLDVLFNNSHLDLNLFAYHQHVLKSYDDVFNKFRLLIKLFVDYRLDIQPLTPTTIIFEDFKKRYSSFKIMDFSSNQYMKQMIETSESDLLEHLLGIGMNDLKNSIPNIINWSDANIGKNSSGYCSVRNAYQHPNLYESTKKNLEKLFDVPFIFNPDGSINRTSEKNQKNLEISIKPILEEIRIFFKKKYFMNTSLPFDELVLFN